MGLNLLVGRSAQGDRQRRFLLGRATSTALFLFFLLALLSSCDRDSGPEPEDPEALVAQVVTVAVTPQTEGANWLNQSVAPLGDGGFAVVWNQGDTWSDIMMQWLDADGKPRLPSGPLKVTAYQGDTRDAVVIGRESGGAYVAFSQVDHHALQVKVQAFDRDMAPLWLAPKPSVTHSGSEDQYEPCLALAPEGGVFVCFHFVGETNGNGIKCQRIDVDGTRAWGDEGIVLSRRNGGVSYPIGVADGMGGVYVFWLSIGNRDAVPPEGRQIEGQHLDLAGKKLWGDAPLVIARLGVSAEDGYSYTDYLAVADGRGGAIVSWNGDLDPGDYHVDTLVQRVNGSGQLLWGEGVPAGGPNQNCRLERLISARDGGVYVAYEDQVDAFGHTRLHVQRLGMVGKKIWGDSGIAIANTSEPSGNYDVYGCFTGSYLSLAWTRQAYLDNYDANVVACRFKKDGTAMDPPDGVMLDGTRGEQNTQGMCFDPVSQSAFVLWVDSPGRGRGDGSDLYGAILVKPAAAATSPPLPALVSAPGAMDLGLKQTGLMPEQRREKLAARSLH